MQKSVGIVAGAGIAKVCPSAAMSDRRIADHAAINAFQRWFDAELLGADAHDLNQSLDPCLEMPGDVAERIAAEIMEVEAAAFGSGEHLGVAAELRDHRREM